MLQVGFGSGFKCNSLVWRALRDIHDTKHAAWKHMAQPGRPGQDTSEMWALIKAPTPPKAPSQKGQAPRRETEAKGLPNGFHERDSVKVCLAAFRVPSSKPESRRVP